MKLKKNIEFCLQAAAISSGKKINFYQEETSYRTSLWGLLSEGVNSSMTGTER